MRSHRLPTYNITPWGSMVESGWSGVADAIRLYRGIRLHSNVSQLVVI